MHRCAERPPPLPRACLPAPALRCRLRAQELRHILREVALLRSAEHPNVVVLKEALRSASTGAVFLVFEHVEHTLSKDLLLNPRGLPPLQARLVMWQLLEALRFLHAKQVVHCDIKPANILVSADGVVKLCDFGLAHSLDLHHGDDVPADAATLWCVAMYCVHVHAPQIRKGRGTGRISERQGGRGALHKVGAQAAGRHPASLYMLLGLCT